VFEGNSISRKYGQDLDECQERLSLAAWLPSSQIKKSTGSP
jgi:hypothetical protein